MRSNYPLDKIPYDIDKIIYYRGYCLLYCENEKFILKKKTIYEDQILKELDALGFYNYLKDYILIDNYKLFSIRIIKNIKIKDIIYTMSILHNKSFLNNKTIIDSYYNANLVLSNELLNYYLKIQDYIDEMEVILPEYYLLLLNISKIYKLINMGRNYLNKWYENSDRRINMSYVIRNNTLDNCIYVDNNLYFLDYNCCKKDIYIVDIAYFYMNYYDDIDITYYIDLYMKNEFVEMNDLYLFFYLISNPFKIKYSNNHQNNILITKELIKYVSYTLNFISEENKKYEETNK